MKNAAKFNKNGKSPKFTTPSDATVFSDRYAAFEKCYEYNALQPLEIEKGKWICINPSIK